MANYGITALSGLSGALDRQDRRNDRRDHKEWQQEYQGQQRKQWGRADEEYEAGAETRDLTRNNQKMQAVIQSADLERKRIIQELLPDFQTVNMPNRPKTDYGQAMAKILSGVNSKEIEFVPTEDERYQFKSKDGKVYGFGSFDEAKEQIGLTMNDPVEFLRKRSEALNEEGLWVTPEGQIIQKKRGEAEKQGLTPYALVQAQGEMRALGRKNMGNFKHVETDKGLVAYNEKDPRQQVALGRAPVSEADRGAGIEAGIKLTRQFKADLAFVLTPFAKPGLDMSAMFSGDDLTEPAKNALESAISFYERNSKDPSLSPQDKMKLQKAEDAIRLYNHMSQTVRNRYDLGENNLSAAIGDDAPVPDAPPIQGAKQAPDGNWYIADPNRPGKYMKIHMGGMR